MPRPAAPESLEQNRGCVTVLVGTLILLALIGIGMTIYTVFSAQDRAVNTLSRGLIDRIVRSDLGQQQKSRIRQCVTELTNGYHQGVLSMTEVRECSRTIDPLIKLGVVASRLRLLALSAKLPIEREERALVAIRRWVFLGLTDRLGPDDIEPIYDSLVDTKPAGIQMIPSIAPDELERLLGRIEREVDQSGVTFPEEFEVDLADRIGEVVRERLTKQP